MNTKYDSVELTKKYLDIESELEEKIEKEMIKRHGGTNLGLGTCHSIWAIKKEILKKDYGISWKSPAELNLDILFD